MTELEPRIKKLMLGIDCGGTNIKCALVDSTAKIVHSKLEAVDYREEPGKVIKKIAKKIELFIARAGATQVKTIGIGIAGDVDSEKGVVRFSPNLGWKNVPLKELLLKTLKLKIIIENDANCAAWGAYWLDAKRDCENLICLTLGTGVGGGIILHSKLYRGSTGSAGEIGHMSIQYNGRPCKCGSFGCVESFVGAWGLIQNAEFGLKKKLAPILKKILQSSSKVTLNPKTLALAAERGDSYCQQLWKDAGEQLGCMMANCVNIFNPDRIILCGGVSKAGSLILSPALHTLGRRAFTIPAQKVKVTISKYDECLGVVGAALLSE